MPLYLSEADVDTLLEPGEAVAAIEDCFRRLAAGAVVTVPRRRVPVPGGIFAIMAATDTELGYAGLKSYTAVDGRLAFVVCLFELDGGTLQAVIEADRVREHFRPNAMLLDLLVSEGVPVGSSQMSIEAVLLEPDDPVGAKLELAYPSAALSLVQTMYLADGRPVQRSHDTFLPGNLNLHVVRELFEVRKLG